MRLSRYMCLLVAIAMVATVMAPMTVGATAIGEEFQVTTNPHSQNQIEMWGDIVVYKDHRVPGNPRIYATDLAAGGEFPVAITTGTQNNPSVYGDVIVYMKKAKAWDVDDEEWEEQGDIWGYRISTGETFSICTNIYEQCNPYVWGDWVVWCDARNADNPFDGNFEQFDLYGYNFATGKETAITTAEGGQHAAAIYENKLVYRSDAVGTSYDSICYMDLNTKQVTTIAEATSNYPYMYHPNVYGDWITWFEEEYYFDGQNHYVSRVMAYNTKTEGTTELKEWDNTWGWQEAAPDVWNGMIVWADTDGASSQDDVEIHMMDLTVGATSEQTLSVGEDIKRGRPRISNGVVTWVDERNGMEDGEDNADIYAVRLEPGYVDVAGTDRYGTAIAASRKTYPGGAENVVIATGTNWPDALSASALAGAVDGPVLLVKPDEVPVKVYAELKRLGAKNAYVVGGSAVISDDVTADLGTFLIGDVTRIGGVNRYSTSAMVANKTKQMLGTDFEGTAMVATGENFPDSVAAAALAAGNGWPILLTEYDEVPASTMSALKSLDVDTCVVLGGSSVISGAVRSALADECGAAPRVWGENRYMTAAAIAQYGVDHGGMTWDGVALATGADFADALAGGVMQGANNSVVLLTEGDALSPIVAGKIKTNKADISLIKFVGGTAAISQPVRDAAWTLIK